MIRIVRSRAVKLAIAAACVLLVIAVAIVGVVALTRIYLGAHYLTDVLGGVAFGLLWLALCDAAVRAIAKPLGASDQVTS